MLWFLQLDPKQLMVPMVSCQGLRGVGVSVGLCPAEIWLQTFLQGCLARTPELVLGDLNLTHGRSCWWCHPSTAPWFPLEGNPANVRGKQKGRRTNLATEFVFEMPHSTAGSEVSQISLTALALPHIYLQTDHRAIPLGQGVAIW